MNWSIYAFIPIVWIGLVLLHGLIRASYEFKTETAFKMYAELAPDVEIFSAEHLITDLTIRHYRGHPNDLFRLAHREVARKLLDAAKYRISFQNGRNHELRYHSITGQLKVVK